MVPFRPAVHAAEGGRSQSEPVMAIMAAGHRRSSGAPDSCTAREVDAGATMPPTAIERAARANSRVRPGCPRRHDDHTDGQREQNDVTQG